MSFHRNQELTKKVEYNIVKNVRNLVKLRKKIKQSKIK